MDFVYLPGRVLIGFCFAILFLLACGQVIHTVVIRRSHECGFMRLTMAYEAMLVIHLVVGTLYLNALGHGWIPGFIAIGSILIPLEFFMWLNVLFFAFGLVLCIGTRKPQIVLELIALIAMTPFVLDYAGKSFMIPVIIDATVFGFVVTRKLLLDYGRSFSHVMPSAVASAMKAMPEGVLIASKDGKILFVNDVMRHLLARFGASADLLGLADVEEVLRDRAGALAHDCSMRVPAYPYDEEPTQTWHVEMDEAMLKSQKCARIFAIDITEEDNLEKELRRANAELAETEAQLVETLENVREAAADEALVRMRSRVHDVIGQNLSLLHRYLEDKSIDDERLEKMKPMLKGMVSDLREDADVDWRIELDSIVSAFSLVGIDVQIAGKLPENLEVAVACTAIIREAVTNAVKHANASVVHVNFTQDNDNLEMSIWDNGTPAYDVPIYEGQGTKGMRTVVDRCGGELDIKRSPAFTITATFPVICDPDADPKGWCQGQRHI